MSCITCRNKIEYCSCVCGFCGEINECKCSDNISVSSEQAYAKNRIKSFIKELPGRAKKDQHKDLIRKVVIDVERKRLEKWHFGRRNFP